MPVNYGGVRYAEHKRAQRRERDARPHQHQPCRKCGGATLPMDSLCADDRAEFRRIGLAEGVDAAEAWASARVLASQEMDRG